MKVFYTGTGPGHAQQIKRGGFIFTRGKATEVTDADLAKQLLGEKGFQKPEKPPTKSAKTKKAEQVEEVNHG